MLDFKYSAATVRIMADGDAMAISGRKTRNEAAQSVNIWATKEN